MVRSFLQVARVYQIVIGCDRAEFSLASIAACRYDATRIEISPILSDRDFPLRSKPIRDSSVEWRGPIVASLSARRSSHVADSCAGRGGGVVFHARLARPQPGR